MKKIGLKIVSLSLILAIVLPFLAKPQPAAAQTNSIARVTACSVGGVIAPWLSDKINIGLTSLSNKLTGAIGSLLGLNSLFGVAGAVPVNDANFQMKWTNKELRMDIIARCAGREIYDRMVGNTLNIIRNHGRDGGPLFIKNWRNFTTGSQYRGETIFRAMLSNTQLCNYFNKDLKTIFGANTQVALPGQNTRVNDLDPYQLKANCTMPADWTLEAYKQDFAGNGGWAAFAKLMEPQNNPMGSYLMALEETAKQRGLEEQLDLAEANAGGGFTSRRGRGSIDSCLVRASNNQCIVYKDILTPGSTLQNSVSSTIEQEMSWITNVDEVSEVITAATSFLLNRMLNLGDNDEYKAVNPADLPTYTNVPPTSASEPPPGGDPGTLDQAPPQNQPLSCSPTTQTVSVGQSATLSASGGDSNYSWSVADGDPSTGTGSDFSTVFPKADAETVRVTSGGITVECYVFIN